MTVQKNPGARPATLLLPLLTIALASSCTTNKVKLNYQIVGVMNPADVGSKTSNKLTLKTFLMPEGQLKWFQNSTWNDLWDFKDAPGVQCTSVTALPDTKPGEDGSFPSWEIGDRGEGVEVLGVVANFSVKETEGNWKQWKRLSDMSGKVLIIDGSKIEIDQRRQTKQATHQ